MRFDQVTAVSFGPFLGEHLWFAPGFTVIDGPNESGKTTWAAALYTSLAGRRRSRGRGTRDEAQFRAKHKPWSGSRWQVAAAITTDDGTGLTITQDLIGGTTRILPKGASRPLSRSELQRRFGLTTTGWDDIDVGELFGLSRGTLRATTFVPQAEILRVLEQAGELQQYLQRAASSQTVDVTAHEVLESLKADLATRVGSLTMGRRPLRRVTEELQEAEDAAYQLRVARDELRQTASRVTQLASDEGRARDTLAEVQSWQAWAEVDSLEAQIGKIRGYEAELTSLSAIGEPGPPEVVQKLRDARIAFLTRDELPDPPTGPSLDDLQSQLAALPELPKGDTSPDRRVRALWEALKRATSSVSSRTELNPEDAASEELPDVASEELRRLANDLRLRRPVWDPREDETEARLRNQHAQALEAFTRDMETWQARSAAYEHAVNLYATARERYASEQSVYEQSWDAYRATLASRTAVEGRRLSGSVARRFGLRQWLLLVGGVLTVVGLTVVFVNPAIGALVAGVGVATVIAGLLTRGQSRHAESAPMPTAPVGVPPPPAPQPPTAPNLPHPGNSPAEPTLSDQVHAIVARRAAWQQDAATFDAAHSQLVERLSARGLPTVADELDCLAQQIDLRDGARQHAEQQRADLVRLEGEVRAAARRLVEALRDKGESVSGPEEEANADQADALYRRYETACSHRAELASAASRRGDLSRAIEARTKADALFRAAVERFVARTDDIIAAARLVGGEPGEDAEAAADIVGKWLEAHELAASARAKRDKIASLREQLLVGSSLEELVTQASAVRAKLGPRPAFLPPNSEELADSATKRVEDCATCRASAEGHLEQLRQQEGDLAGAIEESTARRREKESLVELKTTLELAIEHLEAAQQQAHRSITPVLESAIRRRLPLVTGGRYQDARVTTETLSVELQERSGAWREAALLSQGTTEQTFLLLRLALVEHLETAETMPLILDDVTVQCDATRTKALLSLLHDISKERQVILFSQETGVRDWAATHLDVSGSDLLLSLSAVG